MERKSLLRHTHKGRMLKQCLLSCTRVRKYIYIYIYLYLFANGKVYLGDELSMSYWLLLSRLPACLRQFYSTGNSHQESSYQISAPLIILMNTVNLDGLVYALSTWKYERERQTQHASLKEQLGFMGKPISGVNQDKMSISSIFSGWPQ